MSNTFTYKSDGIILSAQIENVTILTTNSYVDVRLEITAKTLLAERYFAYQGKVTLCDLRSLIEQEMRTSGLSLQRFTLKAFKGSESVEADTYSFAVLYCEGYTIATLPSIFLEENFLTTLPHRRVSPGYFIELYLFGRNCDSTGYKVDFTYRCPDGKIEVYSYAVSGTTLTADRVERIVLSLQNLPERVCDREMCTKWEIEILQVTVTCGDRSATFTVDPALATAQRFCFRNAFNVWEIAELPCAMTHKLVVDRTLASINGASEFYDHSATATFEVETGPLTTAEVGWLTQLFTSRDVMRIEDNPTDDSEPQLLVPVLITDVSFDACAAEEPPTLKFTWRYADNRPMLTLPASPGIFRSPFNHVYS